MVTKIKFPSWRSKAACSKTLAKSTYSWQIKRGHWLNKDSAWCIYIIVVALSCLIMSRSKVVQWIRTLQQTRSNKKVFLTWSISLTKTKTHPWTSLSFSSAWQYAIRDMSMKTHLQEKSILLRVTKKKSAYLRLANNSMSLWRKNRMVIR